MKNLKIKRIFLITVCLLLALASASFAEGCAGHWAAVDLQYAVDKGIINQDDLKYPNREVNRASFLNMVLKDIEGIDLPANSRFSDISSQNYYYKTVLKAEKLHLTDIFDGDRFDALKPITREQSAYIIGKLKFNDINETVLSDFSDNDKINPSAAPYVSKLKDTNVIYPDKKNNFNPKKNISLSESIVMYLASKGERPKRADVHNLMTLQSDGKLFLIDKDNGIKYSKLQAGNKVVQIGDGAYFLDDDSSVKTGIFESDGKTYYTDAKGEFLRGWHEINGTKRYFSPKYFYMYKNGVYTTGKGCYWFDVNGVPKEGYRKAGSEGGGVYWYLPTEDEYQSDWNNAVPSDPKYTRQEIANFTERHQGIPYKWYGVDLNNRSGIYCCGVPYSAYKLNGIQIPGPNDCQMKSERGFAMVRAQWEKAGQYGGVHILFSSYDELGAGDILYYSKTKGMYNHSAIYMGKNGGRQMFVHVTVGNGLMTEPVATYFNRMAKKGYYYTPVGAIRYDG